MKIIAGLFLITFFSSMGFANHEGERGSSVDHFTRFSLGGLYGFAAVSPSDINSVATSKVSTPALGGVSTDWYYGGFLGIKITRRLELRVTYEVQEAKNLSNTSLNSNAGYDLFQTEVWGTLNYFFLHYEYLYGFVGAGVGTPVYSHVTENLATKKEYDADKSLGYIGLIGFGYHLTHHLSLQLQAGYQKITATNLKTGAGATLTTNSGGNANMDLSGIHTDAALVLLF